MTNDELIAAFLARGGKVTQCKAAMPRQPRQNPKAAVTPVETFPPLTVYEAAFLALQAEHPGTVQSADWWAAYEIGPCDPNREIAEAAAAFVIARDEGLESGDLYRRSLCYDQVRSDQA